MNLLNVLDVRNSTKLYDDIFMMIYLTISLRFTLFSFVETPRKFIIAELSIRKLGSSHLLWIFFVSTKLNKYIVFTMQTYKKFIAFCIIFFSEVFIYVYDNVSLSSAEVSRIPLNSFKFSIVLRGKLSRETSAKKRSK